ncbi:MAG: CPBP family intramembrane metalloprotease [Bacteroidia bacterium]|nr:CPBP family intramembrane metalloprotease [Bacteroidia bacterium]
MKKLILTQMDSNKHYIFPSRLIYFILILVVTILLTLPIQDFILYSPKMTDNSMEYKLSLINFIIIPCLITIFLIIEKLKSQNIKPNLDFWHVKNIKALAAFPFVFHVCIAFPIAQLYRNITNHAYTPDNIYIILGAITFAPIFEEFLFREILLKGLSSRYSKWLSILITGVFFGLLHFSPSEIAVIAVAIALGIYLSWVYYQTKNLGACIVLHFIANSTAILLPMLYMVIGNYIFCMSAVTLLTVVYYLYKQKIKTIKQKV